MARSKIRDILGDDDDDSILAPKTRKEPPEPLPTEHEDTYDIQNVFKPVSLTWLSKAFRKDLYTVKKRLADCPPTRYAGGNRPEYDFVLAASYLVDPKFDITEVIKTMQPKDLPVDLQKDYWTAMRAKQRFEEEAGQLWRTEDVLDVFGEAFKLIRTSTQLWASQLERSSGLTQDQYKHLQAATDSLLDELHEKLTSLQNKQKTPNALQRHNEENNEVSDD